MTKKQRRLREKRKSEIRSKKLKRIRQSLHAKYGKLGNVKAGLMFTKKYQQQILACMQLAYSMIMFNMTSRWIHNMESLRISVADTINMYNELRRRSNALLEGS